MFICTVDALPPPSGDRGWEGMNGIDLPLKVIL